ncbi:MAG: hypothetical protein KDC98_05970 [Planctomycetes bacterium]|nr:hypothetical protein [Planctomycetota bacterium]
MRKPSSFVAMSYGLLGIGLCLVGYQLHRENQRIEALEQRLAAREATLEEILGEVTRTRIEQRTQYKGPAGLLEKLSVFAPLLSNASTTAPDHAAAKEEMAAILRAFRSIGKDAWEPIHERFAKLDPTKDFDELKWLLEAAVVVDEKRGSELANKVLLGLEKPTARLRWHAANLLIERNRKLAQLSLRQILLTESSRGINSERAAAYGSAIPDAAAYSQTGFYNFVTRYRMTDDPEMDTTLLMVIGRSEHDQQTVQECVKILGQRRCQRAVPAIEKLYLNPPGFQHNPLFQNHCITALAAIQGEGARPFFEKILPDATTDTVANYLKRLLEKPIFIPDEVPGAAGDESASEPPSTTKEANKK